MWQYQSTRRILFFRFSDESKQTCAHANVRNGHIASHQHLGDPQFPHLCRCSYRTISRNLWFNVTSPLFPINQECKNVPNIFRDILTLLVFPFSLELDFTIYHCYCYSYYVYILLNVCLVHRLLLTVGEYQTIIIIITNIRVSAVISLSSTILHHQFLTPTIRESDGANILSMLLISTNPFRETLPLVPCLQGQLQIKSTPAHRDRKTFIACEVKRCKR